MNENFANPRAISLLSFSIGSPQTLIEASRTLRDLWAGSYLVSWLAASAMKPIIEARCEFVTPHVNVSENLLLAAVLGELKDRDRPEATLPSIPNKFAAIVPADQAETLRTQCLDSACNAWNEICNKVRAALAEKKFSALDQNWCTHWDEQVASYLEFEAVVMPLEYSNPEDWEKQWEAIGQLSEMTRSIRHVPNYRPEGERFAPKCSLLGSFEQMGPTTLAESARFWKDAGSWQGIQGTQIRSADRLSAVSLVKRFAWPVVLAEKTRNNPEMLRFSDTATVAARLWLGHVGIEPDVERERGRDHAWNGQWLHWGKPDEDDDERPCPAALFERIEKRRVELGKPPAYYAIVHLDGDNMGRFFEGERGPESWGKGLKRCQNITRALTGFGGKVQGIVSEYQGELIYCGGDDILALLPTANAVAAAVKMSEQFKETMQEEKASLSGGIAVVHYKEDLRYALKVVRSAEKAAKRSDRSNKSGDKLKDALSIAVCRHAGEHSQFVMAFQNAPTFDGLVQMFQGKITDRWTYKLRQVAELLPEGAGHSELNRLLKRIEGGTKEEADSFRKLVRQIWDDHEQQLLGRNWYPEDRLNNFVTLCQSASFMARGKE